MSDTVLDLSTIPFPAGSSRRIRESLSVAAPAASIRRTVNNSALVLRVPGSDKYAISLSCQDIHLPSFDGLAIGDEITVGLITEMSVRIAAGATSATLARTPVAGSVRARSVSGAVVDIADVNGRIVSIAAQPEDATVFYRPTLTCLVESYSADSDEWAAASGWSLELQEV